MFKLMNQHCHSLHLGGNTVTLTIHISGYRLVNIPDTLMSVQSREL